MSASSRITLFNLRYRAKLPYDRGIDIAVEAAENGVVLKKLREGPVRE